MRFASAIKPLRCAAKALSNSCSGVEYPTAFVLDWKPRPSMRLPIVGVLDVEARCSVELHIDDWAGKPDFIDRARPLEQGSVILMAGGIDNGLSRRRRKGHNHRHGGRRFRNIFRHVDLD